jgi:hypothetical protein
MMIASYGFGSKEGGAMMFANSAKMVAYGAKNFADFDGSGRRPVELLSRWPVGLFLVTLALMVLIQGCMPAVRPQSAKQLETVREAGKSVVLYQFKPEHDADQYQDIRFSISIANMDAAQRLKVMNRDAPSSAAMKGGWYYFLLEPGTYYFSSRILLDEKYVQLRPEFWFHVPEGKPLIYIGSLRIPCQTQSGLLGKSIYWCHTMELSDQTGVADDLAREAFGDLGPLSTGLMQSYNARFTHPLNEGEGAVGVLTGAHANFAEPNWHKRAFGQSTGIGRWLTSDFFSHIGATGSGWRRHSDGLYHVSSSRQCHWGCERVGGPGEVEALP